MINITINNKPIYIMALPDYMLQTFNSKGKSINDFIDNINQLTIHQEEDIVNNVLDYLLNTLGLSKYDVLDIYNANVVLVNYMGKPFLRCLSDRYKQGISNDEINNSYSALINLYNQELDKDFGFNMSNNNYTDKLPFEIIHGGKSIFIILKNGFTNYKLFNVNLLQFRFFIINMLMNSLYNSFTQEEILNSDLFLSLNSSSYLTRVV